MVQIIPKAKSTGDRFAQAFANLGESASTLIPEELQGRKERKQLGGLIGQDVSDIRNPDFLKILLQNSGKQGNGAELERKRKVFEQVQNTEGYKKATDTEKLAIEHEILGNISGGTSKSLINAERDVNNRQAEDNFTKQLQALEGFGNAENSFEEPTEDQNINEKKRPRTADLDAKIAQLSKAAALAPTEKSRKQINDRLDDLRKQQTLEFNKGTAQKKEVSASFVENKPFIDKTHDQYEDSLRRDAILDRMDQLNDSDELSDSGAINSLETLGLKQEWLKNPKNEEFTKLGLDLLGGGTLQADYGSRVLQSEFQVALQRVPTLSQTKEGRRQISENIKTMLLPAKLKNERMQYYLDKSERTDEPLPHDLRGKILKDIKPELEEAYDKFKQRNGRYKVKEGTYPDDNVLEKYYYLSEGDDNKALKLMKEDGYDINS